MLERLFTFGARRHLACSLLLAFLTAVAINGILKLRVNTSYDSFMSAHDPQYPAYQRTIEEFGSDNTTAIYLRDEALFSVERLQQIESLVQALSNLDSVERVDSLFSALNIRDHDGVLEVGPLMETTPEDPEALAAAKANALYSPILTRNLVSEDGRVTAVMVTVRRDRRDPTFNQQLFRSIEGLIAPLRRDFDEVFQVGAPRLNVDIERAMFKDLQRLTPLATVILIGSILYFLGTGVAAVLPLITAGLSIIWTFGFMGYLGLPVTLLTVLLPSLLIVIGSAEDIHMMSDYLQAIADGRGDRPLAIRLMAKKIALPILINSFTTVLGFYANVFTDIVLIQQFAYASSFAMVASFFSTVLLLPLAVSIVSPTSRRLTPEHERPSGVVGVMLDGVERFTTRHRKGVVAAAAALTVVFGYLACKLQVTNDPISYFKSRHPLVRDADTLRRDLAGMSVFFVTLEGTEPDTFKRPDRLKQLETLEGWLSAQGFDKAMGLADVLRLTHREMNGGEAAFDRVPDRQDVIEQYLLLFQRSDLERYVSADYRTANLVVRHHFSDSQTLNRKLADLQRRLPGLLGEDVTASFTGETLMINQAAESLFVGELQSLGMLISVVFVIMALMYTSGLAGVVSLIPNLIPIAINFGTMVLLGIPLNPGTAMVSAIAIGISVDDTTHLLSRYNALRKETADPEEALRLTIWGEAVPVMTTTVSLALGFLILVSSTFTIVAQFGLLSAMTMVVGLLTDLIITPMLLRAVRLVSLWEILAFKVGREVLFHSRLFEGMRPFQIKKAILLSEMTTVPAGTEIIVQGTRGRSMYVVLSGTVAVVRQDGGRTEPVATLGGGEVFGEVGYAQEIERTATVRTTSDVTLLRLDFDSVQKSLRWYPGIAARLNLNVSRILGTRLAGMHARTAHLGLADARS